MNCTNCKQTGTTKNPIVTCRDCQKELCRSCFSVHFRAHEAEKSKSANFKYCVQCGLGKLASGFYECSFCHGPVCLDCSHIHAQEHQPEQKAKYRCSGCGIPTSTECDTCRVPYCKQCFVAHELMMHKQKQTTKGEYCVYCGKLASASSAQECSECHGPVHTPCYQAHLNDHLNRYSARTEYGFNPFENINFEDLFKRTEDVRRSQQEYEKKRQREAEEARARWNETLHRMFYGGAYAGQQSQSNHQQSRQQQATSAPSNKLVEAFQLMGLSTRATVQEVRHAFWRLAKEGDYRHPDKGGSHEAFVQLNNAYEIVLKEAERNER